MPWWAAVVLAAFIGISSYNVGYKAGFSSAPSTATAAAEKIRSDLEMERLKVEAIERATPNAEACLPIVVSGAVDLDEYCTNLVVKSQQADDEMMRQPGQYLEQDLGR